MLPGFQLHTDKDEQGLNTTTNKKVWADLSLLKGNEKSPSFNSTMVELHKMTPAEKENDRDAKEEWDKQNKLAIKNKKTIHPKDKVGSTLSFLGLKRNSLQILKT